MVELSLLHTVEVSGCATFQTRSIWIQLGDQISWTDDFLGYYGRNSFDDEMIYHWHDTQLQILGGKLPYLWHIVKNSH